MVVRGDGVGEGRQRGAGGHPHGLLRAQAVGLPRPGGHLPHHGQLDRFDVGLAHVDRAHGEPVDGGLVEPGQRTVGHDLLGAQQPLRLGDGHAHGRRSHRGVEHPAQLGIHGPHGPIVLRHAA